MERDQNTSTSTPPPPLEDSQRQPNSNNRLSMRQDNYSQKSIIAILEDGSSSPSTLRGDKQNSTQTFATRNCSNSLQSLEDSNQGFSTDLGLEVENVTSSAAGDDGPSQRSGRGMRSSAVVSIHSSQQTLQGSNTASNSKKRQETEGSSSSAPTGWWSIFRQRCGSIINNPVVQAVIIVFICINALMMGIATTDWVEDNDGIRRAFETIDLVFLIIFTIELVMQFIYHGQRLFTDGWLVFDFLIVVLSWSFDSVQVVRAFRIFRALRLVSRLDSLRRVIAALMHVGPSLGAIMFLLILVLYIFAVLCTELFSETELDADYFSRLDSTLFTLLEMMTLEWADTARQVIEYHAWAGAVFVPFLVISSFILFSLVVAVVCDAVTQAENRDSEENKKPSDNQRLLELKKRIKQLTKNQALVTQALHEALQKLEAMNGKS